MDGILAGHISSSKRARTISPATSTSSTQAASCKPEEWKLLSIEKVYDCRYAVPFPPSPPKPHLVLRFGDFRLLCTCRRSCKPESFIDEVDAENGIGLEEEERIMSTEYLVLGHFERREGDKKGRNALLWLSLDDMQESQVTDAAVDAALDKWEEESAHIRKEARKEARTRAHARARA